MKHAQALYGLDALVIERTGIAEDILPLPGGFRVFREPGGISAGTVIFIGVPTIREFSYGDIRKFGYQALCTAASAAPDATDVALTLHGVGYGLDEVECFDAEVAGIFDAFGSQDHPRALTTVTFLEINRGRAERMRAQLASLLGSEPGGKRLNEVGSAQGEKPHAFVAMPFGNDFDDVFHYGISSAVRQSGLLCERIDRQAFTGDVLNRLKDEIRTAKLVVADLTDANPNVFLEVGYAWGTGKPTVLVCRAGSELLFDVQGQRCIFYDSIKDLEDKLVAELAQLV